MFSYASITLSLLSLPAAIAVAFPGQTPPPKAPNQNHFALARHITDHPAQRRENANLKRWGNDIVTCAVIPLSEVAKISPDVTTPIPAGCTSGICGFSGNYVGCVHYSTEAIISSCIDFTSSVSACGTDGYACGDATYSCRPNAPFCQTYVYDGRLTAFGCESTSFGPIAVSAVSITPYTPVTPGTGSLATQTATSSPTPTQTIEQKLHLPFSLGTLIGIAAGGLVLLCCICCLSCCWRARRRRRLMAVPVQQPQQWQQPQVQQPQQAYYPPPPPQQQQQGQYPPGYAEAGGYYNQQAGPKYTYQESARPMN